MICPRNQTTLSQFIQSCGQDRRRDSFATLLQFPESCIASVTEMPQESDGPTATQ